MAPNLRAANRACCGGGADLSTLEERQRRRSAAGLLTAVAVVDAAYRVSPGLGEVAEKVVDAPIPIERNPIRAAAEIRDGIGAVRMLGAHREIAEIEAVLRDDPDHPDSADRRQRLAQLTAYVGELDRSGCVRPRPWGRILAMEAKR